jgi:predicted ribonuclease YlaK
MGEDAAAPPLRQQHKEQGQHPQVMGEGAIEAPSSLLEKPDFKKWAEVEQQVIEITRKRLAELSPIKDDKLSEEQEAYIHALCDPETSIVVCQGGAGSGKTYTAMLAACLALEAGLLRSVKQTKPLVSTAGVGLGFERGEMADKLKYWCAPAREAMERIQMSEESRKRVEAFPIDRTRGISVPAHEQMIFDEMQNAPKPLRDAAMTRAEEFGKVVLR